MLTLPVRLGGLGITSYNPVQLSSVEYDASTKVTEPLQSLLLSQTGVCSADVRSTQLSLRSAVQHLKSVVMTSTKEALLDQAPPSLKGALELASEWGASNWLTVLPVQEHGMLLLSGMAGILLDFLIIALVRSSFLLNMFFLALKVAFQLLDTMKYVN